MCEGEPYAIPDDGTEEGALLLDPKISMDIYKEMISTYPAYVYFSGDIDDKSIKRFIDNFLSGRRSSIKRIDSTNIKKSITSVKKINEKMDVNQGNSVWDSEQTLSHPHRTIIPLLYIMLY